MIKTTYQTPELRDSNDNIVQEGAFGKNTALSNSDNTGWIDYVVNNLEALHDTIGDSAAHLDGNGHVVEPCNLAIGDEDGNRLKTSYLKLTGGTVSGTLNVAQNLKMQDNQENVIGGLYVPSSSSTNQFMRMYGGSAHDAGGAQLTLKQDGDGRFYLTAKSTDGSQTYDLRGDNNGSLYWRGWNVITSAGGTLTGQLVINKDNGSLGGIKLSGSRQNYAMSVLNTSVTKGSAPSATQYWGVDFYGKDNASYNQRIGMLETSLNANNVATTAIRAYNCTTNTNTANCSIAVSVDGDGNAYTYAPTPAVGDNTTKIATTAFVRQNALPLSGGTMTGNISFNKTNPDVIGNRTTSRIGVFAGANNFDGAGLQCFGREDSTYAGMFYLRASTKSSSSDSGGTVVDLVGRPDGTLRWNGNDITPQILTSLNPDDVDVPNNAVTTLATFTLTKGTWLVHIDANFQSNATGYRRIGIATSGTAIGMGRHWYASQQAVNGIGTVMSMTTFVTVTGASQTYYFNAQQTSGTQLTVGNGLQAFRVSSAV